MPFRYAELEDAIVDGVRRAVEGRRVAVAFSGGLDSGLAACLSDRYAESVTLYTCGSDGSFDVLAAEELSETIGLPWVHVRISEDDVEDTIRRLISATGTDDPFTISYELQLFTVCERAPEPVVVSGQGADEYFMGCAKYVGCTDGDYDAYVKDGVRRLMDVSDDDVVGCVRRIDPAELRPADMDSRKKVLKEVATDLGYPFLAHRTKKSSQYGSGTTDIVRALAKRRGLMYNRYIQSLYEEVFPPSEGD